MRPSHRPPLILLVGALVGATLGGDPAHAAEGDKPKAKMRIVRARPTADLGLPQGISLRPASSPSLPPPGQPGAGFNSTGFASGGLAQNGLRSSLPLIGDPAAQCRTACSQSRITCDSQDAALECSPRWAMCIAGCRP